MRHIPNILSALRFLGAICLLFCSPANAAFWVIYGLCGVSDMLDGTLARKLHAESKSGAVLDSVADICFVACCAIKLIPVLQIPTWLWIWAGVIVLIKLVNQVSALAIYKRLCFPHTPANKLTGLLLFLSVPMTSWSIIPIAFVAVVATFAAVQEGHFIRTRKKPTWRVWTGMKRNIKVSLKILRWVGTGILSLIVLLFLTRWIGQSVNKRTPKGGINTSMYVDINGAKQWISIYGQNKDNPVLLYLHGGPGESTSLYDYAFTRKWSDVYTVVTWDQRGCGKSYDKSHPETITADIMMQDGKAMTEFLRDCLQVEKITLLGHSWGSYFGANLALAHPDYYEAFIGTGQFIDWNDNEHRLYEAALTWSENDPEGREMVEKWALNEGKGYDMEHILLRNAIMERYGYGMMKDGTDYNLVTSVLFNPNYSLKDIFESLNSPMDAFEPYLFFIASDGFKGMSLLGRYDYEIPFFNINGDLDYQTSYSLACEYFEQVSAPKKQMFVMKDATHGLLESRSEEFSGYLHQIAPMK